MERPAKRQKLSSDILYHEHQSATAKRPDRLLALPSPTRTLDLAAFQRPHFAIQQAQQEKPKSKRRNAGRIILPRAPDVTVTADVLEVAVNDGSTATQIALPTNDVAITLSSLGTLTVPVSAASSASESPSSARSGSSSSTSASSASTASSRGDSSVSSSSPIISTSIHNNGTLSGTASSSDRTVTVTATSTFHVSYNNGTFIAATSTRRSDPSKTNSNDAESNAEESTSVSGSYGFGQDMTSTFDLTSTVATGISSNPGVSATATTTVRSGSDPTSSSGSGSGDGGGGSGGPVLTPQQTQMVGGIVGGLAGMALIAVVLLYVLRWYKQRLKANSGLKGQIDFDPAHDHAASGLVDAAAPMSQSSRSLFSSSSHALVTTPKKWRPGSDMTAFTASSTESKTGFQRLSGRKIPSVLSTGGDQFGGSYGAFDEKVGMAVSSYPSPVPYAHNRAHNHDLSEHPLHRDQDGLYVGNRSTRSASRSAPTTPVYGVFLHNQTTDRSRRPTLTHLHSYQMEDLDRALTADVVGLGKADGFAVIRNSPARTPVTQSPTTSSIALPIHTPIVMDEDVPEIPLSPTGYGYGFGLGHDLTPARQIPSRLSARSTSSSGRFKEELP